MRIGILIVLAIVGLILTLIYYDPAIEKVSYKGYRETRIWYNAWLKCKEKDVFTRKYTTIYKKKISNADNK